MELVWYSNGVYLYMVKYGMGDKGMSMIQYGNVMQTFMVLLWLHVCYGYGMAWYYDNYDIVYGLVLYGMVMVQYEYIVL